MNASYTIGKFVIEHFRGLNNLTLSDLSRVNVFAGANNSGKTSILEAIRLMSNPSNIGELVALSMLRASPSSRAKAANNINYILNIFQKDSIIEEGNSFYRIKIHAQVDGIFNFFEADANVTESIDAIGNTRPMLELSIKNTKGNNSKPTFQTAEIISGIEQNFTATEKKLYNAVFIYSTVNHYKSTVNMLSNYIISEGKSAILSILKSFDPHIDEINIVGDDIYLHNSVTGSLPLFSYGAGMQKAVFLTVAIANSKDGVILIDEIDNTIHVSALEDLFQWFLDACLKYNVQAFVTTHSAEALDAILRVTHEQHSNDDLLRIITLRKNYSDNAIYTKKRTGEEAYQDRENYELELRI